MNYPKVLIISRGVWDDNGTSSTLSNIFCDYPSECLAHLYIETKNPNTRYCQLFFQISEYSLIRKLYKWKTITGRQVESSYKGDAEIAKKEASMMSYVRGHRAFVFTILRELLWGFNGWKSKELDSFVKSFNPDVIWVTGSPLILMNRVAKHVIAIAEKPYCLFEMDDVYSYLNCGCNPFKYLYRFLLRKIVKDLICKADQLFVISPKMKREFDSLFGVNSLVLTKGIDCSIDDYKEHLHKPPIHIVYLGQVIYGRLSTISMLASVLCSINSGEEKVVLDIYTGNNVDESVKLKMTQHGDVCFHEPVPYSEVPTIIAESDVVLFVESFEKKFRNIARLSFSTKITDYLRNGKCILAIGPNDVAPIEYFVENDSAVVATNEDEIAKAIDLILQKDVINRYSKQAYECGRRNHDKVMIEKMVFGKILELGL